MAEAAYCIVRLAGLPAEALEAFHSSLCEELPELARLEEDLAARRAVAVEAIHLAVPEADAVSRRLLLKAKRACFNGRDLGAAALETPAVRQQLRDVAAAEAAVGARRRLLADAIEARRWREREALAGLVTDSDFAHAVGLASPSTGGSLHRLAADPRSFGRKELKLEQSVLRFATRAAYKLSPFSTFTPVGLGILEDGAVPGPPLQWIAGRQSRRSLLRLKRYLFHQIAEVLFTVADLRPSLQIALNSSFDQESPGRFRFFRRGFRGVDREKRSTRLYQPSIVRLALDPRLVEHLAAAFGGRRLPYGRVLEILRDFYPAQERAAKMLDGLLEVGLLEPVVPWLNTDPKVETRFLEYLLSLPASEPVAAIAATAGQLLDLEESFAELPDPGGAVQEIHRLLREIWRQAVELAELEPESRLVHDPDGDLYEDTFLESPSGELVRLQRAGLEKVAQELEPLLALDHFYSRRTDFVLSCRALLERECPGRRRIGLMEAHDRLKDLHGEYLRSEVAFRTVRDWSATFDPLALPLLGEIRRLRAELGPRLAGCLEPSPAGLEIDRAALAELAAQIPETYRLPIGGCLFAQPADEDGTSWVLNRLYEGTGRYSSRYTAVMRDVQRDALTACFRHGAAFEIGDRPVEILDLMCAQGDTLNVHARQTPRILEFPGEAAGATPSRRLTLHDLYLELAEKDPGIKVVDRSGHWLLPTHLGGTQLRAMPILVKFLSLFGAGDLHALLPRPAFRPQGEVEVRDRVSLGSTVVMRRRWRLHAERLIEATSGQDDASFFLDFNRWRLAHQIPDQVYAIEKRPSPLAAPLYKPQFLDFTSPSFVAIFRSIVKSTPLPIVVEEALPAPKDFPRTPDGRRRAIEIQLEAVALGPRDRPEKNQESLFRTSAMVVGAI